MLLTCGTFKNIMKNTFSSWSWNSEDLVQCKQAFVGLRLAGFSIEELMELDFGNLDLYSVDAELTPTI